MKMEIEGHEFFGADGKMIWYDLQTPQEPGSSGWPVTTSQAAKGPGITCERSEWSVHFNVSPDGKLFAGDGGGPDSVAAPGNGQWIYLFRPELVATELMAHGPIERTS